MAPDLSDDEVKDISHVLRKNNIDGLIATNTTLARDKVSDLKHGSEQGGLSGDPVKELSTAVIAGFNQHLNGEIPIIGVGGISNAADAVDKIKAGADLVQIYTGLIYQGMSLISQSKKAIAQERES